MKEPALIGTTVSHYRILDRLLARLGLARAAALTGDIARSRGAYQDFLALWKDADPDVPVLIEARAEYAKLPPS